MASRRERTYFAIGPDRDLHEITASGHRESTALSAFALREVVTDWRVLEEGRYAREAAIERLIGLQAHEERTRHASAAAFFAAIGYGPRERRLTGDRVKRFIRDSKRPGGGARVISAEPYRVALRAAKAP